MSGDIRFRVLGSLEVEVDGHRIQIEGVKARRLLAALLVNRNRSVSADSLAEALWGDAPPLTAAKSIHKYVSQLRKHLGSSLVTTGNGYLLRVESEAVDSDRFEQMIERDGSSDTIAVEEALAMWRGHPYQELEDSGEGHAEVVRLEELKLSAQERLIEMYLDRGDNSRAAGLAEGLVGTHPYRERLWAQLMLALYGSGRQSEALDAYRRLRLLLGEELGIEPSRELKELEERILLQDPNLSPGARAPTNLSAPLSTFVGRTDEMANVRDLLARARLVTILGPAGSGKTRMAREVGRAEVHRFAPSGVWFVDLAPVRSPDGVVEAIAKPLAVGGSGDKPTRSVLAQYLAGRRVMLILDNCEHLVDRVAEVAEDLLRASPESVVLATSRERLGVPGEVLFDLPPLPFPAVGEEATDRFDAVRLFVERAAAADTGFRDGDSSELIGEIVRSLEGIPLAIELAAARVRSLGLSGLGERLGDRFEVLTSSERHGVDRHQTLLEAIDWSFRLLGEDEQILFERLTVFRGGFTLEAALEVCGYEPLSEHDVVDLISELVDKSLVMSATVPGGGKRFTLLEMLREFGQRRLAADLVGHLRTRHALYYHRLAQLGATAMRGPSQSNWFQALSADHDNLNKALQWAATSLPTLAVETAVALARYWDAVGPRSEGHEWLRRAVEMSRSLGEPELLDALLAASDLFSSMHASFPLGYGEEALRVARALGDRLNEARALRAISWAHALEEDAERAMATGLEAVQIMEVLGDRWELAHTLERLGQASVQDAALSIEVLTRALGLFRAEGDRTREAVVLYKLADRLANSLGDVESARANVERSLEICDEVGNFHDGAHARLEHGRVLRRAGEYERAEVVLREACAQLTRVGDERCSVRALTALGITLIASGESQAGRDVLEESLNRGRDLEERHTTRAAVGGLATLEARHGDPRTAVSLLAFAEGMARDAGLPVPDDSRERRQATLDELRASLGGELFEELWERGLQMGVHEAVALALGAARSGGTRLG